MAIGQDFYDNAGDSRLANFAQHQGNVALSQGDQAARYADPVMDQRKQFQDRLLKLIENPGGQETSPYFQYLRDTQMEAVKANNAGNGLTRSGRGLMALQDRAAGVASQAYFPQVQALTRLAGFDSASPAAAGLAYSRGAERGQDYQSIAQAQRSAGGARPSAPATLWGQDDPRLLAMARGGGDSFYGLPSGGSLPYNPNAGVDPLPSSRVFPSAQEYALREQYWPTAGPEAGARNTPRLGNWDMSNDPYAPMPGTTPAYNPASPYGDYTQGGYD